MASFQRKIFDLFSKNHNLKTFLSRRNLSQNKGTTRQIPREKPAIRKRGKKIYGIPLLLIPITTFGLGTWQVQRRTWKIELIEELEDKVLMRGPVPLPLDIEDIKDMQFIRVAVNGTFDHSREFYVGPRSNVQVPEAHGLGVSSAPGVYVITPFKLADRDLTILVNRGYVELKDKDPRKRQQGQIQGEVALTGCIRLSEKKSYWAQSGNQSKDGYWMYTNVEEFAKAAKTAPVLIDADYKTTVKGGPIGGQTRVALRNEHMTYIITWYGLCLITGYLWWKNFGRPLPHRSVIDYIKKNQHKL